MTSGSTSAEPAHLSGSVSARYVSGIVTFAEQCGADRAAVLLGAELHESDLADADQRLPLTRLPALFAHCAHVLRDAAFALRFGVGVQCAQITLASALAAAQPEPAPAGDRAHADPGPRTLRDALDGLNRYAALGVDFGIQLPATRYRFVNDDAGVWLEDCRPCRDAHAWPMLTESTFARFATGIRKRGGERIVRALEVTHDAPADDAHLRAYQHVFRAPVRFGAARNALCLDPAFLERPLEPLPAPVQDVLTRHANAQLQRLQHDAAPRNTIWRERVETVLRASLAGDTAVLGDAGTLEQVCRTLAVSRHTLHRRLQAEGTTFGALYDHVRCRMANELLRSPNHTIGAVALRLGFSEAAAFSRAYKRWTGQRPGAVRRAG